MILPRNVLLFFIKRSTEVHAWLGKVRFLLGGGPGPQRGGSSGKYLENGEGQTFWSWSLGEGHRFFITIKSLLHVTSIKSTLYLIIKIQTLWKTETPFLLDFIVKQSMRMQRINRCWNIVLRNYVLPAKIIIPLNPCPLSSIFWCL